MSDVLIDAIYDAAVDPSRWDELLGRLMAEVGAASALAYQPYSPGEGLWSSANLDPASLTDYAGHFHHRDIWRESVLSLGIRTGTVVTSTLHTPEHFLRSEFYNDFLRRYDIRDTLCLYIGNGAEDRETVHLSLYAPHRRGPFEDGVQRRFDSLLPHLSRALEIRRRLEPARHRADALTEALDALARPVIVVDRHGRILHANGPAEAILRRRDGLSTSAGHLRALMPGEQRALLGAIERASGPPGTVREATALRVSRPEDHAPLSVVVSPPGPARAGIAIVLMADVGSGPAIPDRVLSALFGLTAAEAALAQALASGRRLEEAADARGVTRETARSQLKSIFAKTGINSQAGLVRLILSIPSVGPCMPGGSFRT